MSLGSNKGDRIDNLKKAVIKIGGIGSVRKQSSVLQTFPWGRTDQQKFLNMVMLVSVDLNPFEFLNKVGEIEASMGKYENGHIKWGSRSIDIDILSYGSHVIQGNSLRIPHPLLHKRSFVLNPFSEIAPEYVLPGFDKTIFELKESLDEDN
ncbi:MAG: 2-amino-4-hydroxy-6-hydroxymethyldihydropteridine diphosphokinase [Planctomycetes bacterium]|nr:2-amino-4-hydroxy-6-hydroxymethyldihydropteridine diphosphokinase [Planctomycetota bacterium]